ncbi:GntR family transcriptional regulator (plasmid) [Arthrobacter sp. D3-18]
MKTTAVEKAYSWVRRAIIDGTLPGGTFIDEAVVCEATGVSRTPAREAFHRLEGERFITLVPRRGAQVREVNSGDLRDAYGARFMIESFAATEFCARDHSVRPPDAMLENLAIMNSASDFEDLDAYYTYQAADQAFHGALVQTLNNQAVSNFFSSLWQINQLAMYKRVNPIMQGNHPALNLFRQQHTDIYDALARHDQEAVISLLRSHLSYNIRDFSFS